MARTTTRNGQVEAAIGVPITKFEKGSDGVLLVHGKVTDETLDTDEQIVDREFARKALGDWFKDWGNLRQMHSGALPPAGVAVELDERDDGFWITGRVVEPGAVKLVEEGVYKAFSVGIAKPRFQRDPQARAGRIVGGKVCEVSLVDFPANPTTKFAVVKIGEASGLWEEVEEFEALPDDIAQKFGLAAVTKAGSGDEGDDGKSKEPDAEDEDEKPDDEEKDDKGDAETDDQKAAKFAEAERLAKVYAAEYVVYKRDFSTAERKKLADEGKALPDGSYPIESKEDLGNAIHLAQSGHGDVAAAKALIKRRAKALGAEDMLPDDWKGADAETTTVEADLVKRLHDMLCPAYDWGGVVEEYPWLAKNGVASAFGDTVVGLLYQMLQSEVGEDGGTGTEACDIEHLSKAYKCVCEFRMSEALEGAAETGLNIPVMLAEARADIHKAFKAANPDLSSGSLPKPSDPPKPGQFKRGYLSSGHARESATGGGGRMPKATPIEADDFNRGLITDGHERNSPANKRAFYTNAMRDASRTTMQVMHDHIAAVFPDLCSCDPSTQVGDHSQDGAAITKAENNDSAGLETPTLPPEGKAPKNGMPDVEVMEVADLQKQLAAAMTQINDLTQQVETLAASPDPRGGPVRGSGIFSQQRKAEFVGKGDKSSTEASDASTEVDPDSFQAFVLRQAQSGDASVRSSALAAAESLGIGHLI